MIRHILLLTMNRVDTESQADTLLSPLCSFCGCCGIAMGQASEEKRWECVVGRLTFQERPSTVVETVARGNVNIQQSYKGVKRESAWWREKIAQIWSEKLGSEFHCHTGLGKLWRRQVPTSLQAYEETKCVRSCKTPTWCLMHSRCSTAQGAFGQSCPPFPVGVTISSLVLKRQHSDFNAFLSC